MAYLYHLEVRCVSDWKCDMAYTREQHLEVWCVFQKWFLFIFGMTSWTITRTIFKKSVFCWPLSPLLPPSSHCILLTQKTPLVNYSSPLRWRFSANFDLIQNWLILDSELVNPWLSIPSLQCPFWRFSCLVGHHPLLLPFEALLSLFLTHWDTYLVLAGFFWILTLTWNSQRFSYPAIGCSQTSFFAGTSTHVPLLFTFHVYAVVYESHHHCWLLALHLLLSSSITGTASSVCLSVFARACLSTHDYYFHVYAVYESHHHYWDCIYYCLHQSLALYLLSVCFGPRLYRLYSAS